jgi:aspartate 1-decarboxylase
MKKHWLANMKEEIVVDAYSAVGIIQIDSVISTRRVKRHIMKVVADHLVPTAAPASAKVNGAGVAAKIHDVGDLVVLDRIVVTGANESPIHRVSILEDDCGMRAVSYVVVGNGSADSLDDYPRRIGL